jgi:hypothetical protein
MKRLYYGSINQLGGNPMRSPMRYAVNRAARELTDGEFIFGLILISGFVTLFIWSFTV